MCVKFPFDKFKIKIRNKKIIITENAKFIPVKFHFQKGSYYIGSYIFIAWSYISFYKNVELKFILFPHYNFLNVYYYKCS